MQRQPKPRHLAMILLLCLSLCHTALQAKPLVCGVATGFPPYQFTQQGVATGFDVEVVKLLFTRLKRDLSMFQRPWDLVFNELRYGNIDLIAGMEVNPLRKKIFDFTQPYYHRYDAVFILEDNKAITQLDDLHNQFVSGDRHSFVENHWKKLGTLYHFRIIATETKAESMQQLKEGKTQAAIMPKAVGLYLANQLGINVKILDNPDPGSPVAFAVKKGNIELLTQIESALNSLIEDGEIERLYQKWFPQHSTSSRPDSR